MPTSIRIIHPGEILKKEFLETMNVSAYRLAQVTGIPQSRLSNIVGGRLGISSDTALRLAAAFGNSPEFWLNLQAHYDVETARRIHGLEYQRITPLNPVAA